MQSGSNSRNAATGKPVRAPVPDMDPKIADAFKAPPGAPADMWPLYAKIRGVPLLVIRGALSDLAERGDRDAHGPGKARFAAHRGRQPGPHTTA